MNIAREILGLAREDRLDELRAIKPPEPEQPPSRWGFFIFGMAVGAMIMQLIWIDVIFDLPACIAPTLKFAGWL